MQHSNIVQQIKSLVTLANQCFIHLTEEEKSGFKLKTTPSKWSKKEILGHLIDSAQNNLRRFLEIQYQPLDTPYMIQTYAQDELVRHNHYQLLPLQHILRLWVSTNEQIVYVLEHIPHELFSKRIALPDSQEKSFQWLIEDYIDHLKHHLDQIIKWPEEALTTHYKVSQKEASEILRIQSKEFVSLFTHGSLEVELYIPDKTDKQQPHERDEVYTIISGSGEFILEEQTYTFDPGDVFFVPAGTVHRFVNFTEDFKVWVFFYGTWGGERSNF